MRNANPLQSREQHIVGPEECAKCELLVTLLKIAYGGSHQLMQAYNVNTHQHASRMPVSPAAVPKAILTCTLIQHIAVAGFNIAIARLSMYVGVPTLMSLCMMPLVCR